MKTVWLHIYPCFKKYKLANYFCIRSEEDKKCGAFFYYHGKINVNLQIQPTANADRILAGRLTKRGRGSRSSIKMHQLS